MEKDVFGLEEVTVLKASWLSELVNLTCITYY
jgi:hypothetical protein